MKLPHNKKERNQVLMLVGIVGIAALYGLYQLVSIYMLEPRAEKKRVLIELTEKIEKADTHIRMIPENKDGNDAMILQIKDISDKYILHPRLGNYLLPAKEFVESYAIAVKANLLSVKEIGITEFPAPEPPKPVDDSEMLEGKKAEAKKGEAKKGETKKVEEKKPEAAAKPVAKDYAFKTYTVRVSIENGIHDLIRLIRLIEEANPYACISSINIAARPDSPDKHEISFDVQWPIWGSNKLTSNILSHLEPSDFAIIKDETSGPDTAETQDQSPVEDQSEEMTSKVKEQGVPVQ